MTPLARFWRWATAWPRGLLAWTHAALCALLTEEGRKAWGIMLAAGGCMAMTLYAGAALWFVRGKPMLAFWLGLSANFIILVVLTAFTGLVIKRSITAKKGDAEIGLNDHDGGEDDRPPVA